MADRLSRGPCLQNEETADDNALVQNDPNMPGLRDQEKGDGGQADQKETDAEASEDETAMEKAINKGIVEGVSNEGRGDLYSRAGGEPQSKKRKVFRCRRKPRDAWVQVYVVRTLNDMKRGQRAVLVGQRHFGPGGTGGEFSVPRARKGPGETYRECAQRVVY